MIDNSLVNTTWCLGVAVWTDGQTNRQSVILIVHSLATMTVLVSLSSRKGMSPPVTRQVYSPEVDREASPTFIRLNILRENLLSFFFFKVPSEISHLYLFLVIKDYTYILYFFIIFCDILRPTSRRQEECGETS